MGYLLYAAWVLLVLGVALHYLALKGRKLLGLSSGETVALDDVSLYSEELGLVGRPDRIVREREFLIPEEWKSSKRVNDGHRLQLGTYFLLIEAEYGSRPPYGFVVLGDGSRHRVENTEELRSKVLAIVEQIRERRRVLREEIPVEQPAAKCRVCGQRENCGQASR